MNNPNFSATTQHIIDVVDATRDTLRTRVLLNNDITEETVKSAINSAINSTAQSAAINASTVAAACQRNLGVTAEGFEDLIYDHFTGGNQLIDAVVANAKVVTGNDNPSNIRAALNDLRLTV